MGTYSSTALGLEIRHLRDERSMTQEELGRKAGYGAGAGVSISRIENGRALPSPERFAGIAAALDMTPAALTRRAAERTTQMQAAAGDGTSHGRSIKERIAAVQEEVERRTDAINSLGEAFNQTHDQAAKEFFMPFVHTAERIKGAPQPDPEGLGADDDSSEGTQAAQEQLLKNTHAIADVIGASVGGAAAGAAVGGLTAYGTFVAAATFGTASTGAAIGGLSGVAATNATLALLGGGSLAMGGAGIAGGTALLMGIVAAPALILAVGGLAWAVKRSRKQRQETLEKLDQAERELNETRINFDALCDVLRNATTVLGHIAIHAGRAFTRWQTSLGALPVEVEWDHMSQDNQEKYQNFMAIAACQISVATINVQELMASRDPKRAELIEYNDEILSQAQTTVERLV